MIDVNWLGVFLAAVSAMVVGSVWYAKPVFGSKWQTLLGFKDKDLQEGAAKALAGMFVLALVTAYVLAHLIEMSHEVLGYSYVQSGLCSGLFAWLGFSMTAIVGQALFEKRNQQLTLLNVGNQFVTLVVMGLVYGFLQS